MSISKQIIGSFEDIGKDVLKETTKVPQDIVGKAIESLSATSTNKKQTAQQSSDKPAESTAGPLQELDSTKDLNVKKAIARAALSQLAGQHPKPKEPGVWERKQKEKEEQDAMKKQQVAVAQAQTLNPTTHVRRRGDLFGIKAKKAGSELGKNVRQD